MKKQEKILKAIAILLGIVILGLLMWQGYRNRVQYPEFKGDGMPAYINGEKRVIGWEEGVLVVDTKESDFADREVEFIFLMWRNQMLPEFTLVDESEDVFLIESSSISEGLPFLKETKRRLRVGINGEESGKFWLSYYHWSGETRLLEVQYEGTLPSGDS